jgi:hypothetical protein
MKRSPHSDPGPGHQILVNPQGPQLPGKSAEEDKADSDPDPHPHPNSQQQQQQPSLEQWNLVLDTIRSNLNLIAGTWGRQSRQYDEARGVMLSYLEENLGRLRLRGRRGVNDDDGMAMTVEGDAAGEEATVGTMQARAAGDDGRGDDADMAMATLEKGIEELMGELRI